MGQEWTCGVFAWPCLAVGKPSVRCRGETGGEESRLWTSDSCRVGSRSVSRPTAGRWPEVPRRAPPAGVAGSRIQWLRPVDTVDGQPASNVSHTKTQSASFVSRHGAQGQYLAEFHIPSPGRPIHRGISNARQTPVSPIDVMLPSSHPSLMTCHEPKPIAPQTTNPPINHPAPGGEGGCASTAGDAAPDGGVPRSRSAGTTRASPVLRAGTSRARPPDHTRGCGSAPAS